MQIQLAVSETHFFSSALTYLSRWSPSVNRLFFLCGTRQKTLPLLADCQKTRHGVNTGLL